MIESVFFHYSFQPANSRHSCSRPWQLIRQLRQKRRFFDDKYEEEDEVVVILIIVLIVVLVLVLECISNILAKTSVSFSIKMAAVQTSGAACMKLRQNGTVIDD